MWLLQNFQKIKVLSLTFFLYLISPLIILSVVVLYLYRNLVHILAKISRSDLSGIINPSTSVYCCDEMYSIPNRNTVCYLVLKGKLSLDTLQDRIERKILDMKTPKGQYKYPQLRMYPSRFHKYLFWKEEEEFKVGTHVIMYDKARDNNRIWTLEDLQEIQRNLIRKQWTRFASPWEILLLPNYRTQSCGGREVKTVLCVRFHMCLANEVPWMSLLTKVLCEEERVSVVEPDVDVCKISSSSPKIDFLPFSSENSSAASMIVNLFGRKFGKTTTDLDGEQNSSSISIRRRVEKLGFFIREILKRLAIPFRIPFDFAEQFLEPLPSSTKNEWDVKERSLLKRDHVVMLDRFSVQHVKEIRKMLGVTFSSVLITALSSALRVTFIEAGYKLPSHMKVMLPVLQQDPTEEGVRQSLCWINLPLGISSSKERLRVCEAAQKKYVHGSTRLLTNRFLLNLVGLLPFKYHWYFLRKRPWIGVMMNVKGPKETLTLCDHQVEDVIISSASDSGFVLSFVSYADYLRISLVIDYRLVPSEIMAKNLLKNVYAELVLLGIDGNAATV